MGDAMILITRSGACCNRIFAFYKFALLNRKRKIKSDGSKELSTKKEKLKI